MAFLQYFSLILPGEENWIPAGKFFSKNCHWVTCMQETYNAILVRLLAVWYPKMEVCISSFWIWTGNSDNSEFQYLKANCYFSCQFSGIINTMSNLHLPIFSSFFGLNSNWRKDSVSHFLSNATRFHSTLSTRHCCLSCKTLFCGSLFL